MILLTLSRVGNNYEGSRSINYQNPATLFTSLDTHCMLIAFVILPRWWHAVVHLEVIFVGRGSRKRIKF